MTDARGLAVQAVALRVLADRVKQRTDQVKADLATSLDPGDRKTATLDDGTKVGSISYAVGRRSVRVVDERALADWVADNYPDEVVPQVRDAFKRVLFDGPTEGAVLISPDGEVVPGVEVVQGSPYLSVKPDPKAVPALVEAIRANQLLALEQPTEDEP